MKTIMLFVGLMVLNIVFTQTASNPIVTHINAFVAGMCLMIVLREVMEYIDERRS